MSEIMNKALPITFIFFFLSINYISAQIGPVEEDTFIYSKIEIEKRQQGNLPLNLNGSTIGKTISTEGDAFNSRSSVGQGSTPGFLTVSGSGASNYNIPIAVPEGVNGVHPEISITYNSQEGNGLAGYGWNITGVSTITRIPATKYHNGIIDGVDFDIHDQFALDGQRLLLKVAYGNEYQTEVYSNVKIVKYGTSPYGSVYGPEYFIVYYPDGSKAYYGSNSNSRTRTSYAITYWENPQGLRISYQYFTSNEGLSITSIKYGSRLGNTAPSEIRFTYTNTRKRVEQGYIGNYSHVRLNLLKKIEVFNDGSTYRLYDLSHDETSLKYNRLRTVQEYSGDGLLSNAPIILNYQNTPSYVNYDEVTATSGLINVEKRNSNTVSLDLTGNGKMDFIIYPKQAKNKFYLIKNLNGGSTNYPYEVNTGPFETIFPTTLLSHNDKVLPGQGITVVKENSNNTIGFNVYSDGTTNPIYLQYTKTFNLGSYINGGISRPVPRVYISGDFNGDGLTDVLAVGKPYNGSPDYNSITFVDLKRNLNTDNTKVVGPLNEKLDSSHRLYTGDFNGDGKTDLLQVTNTKMYVYTLNDNNNLNLLWQQTISSYTTDDPILLGDYNGDGKTDFIYPRGGNNDDTQIFSIGISTGTSFNSVIKTMPYTYHRLKVVGGSNKQYSYDLIPVDINGDGRTDIVYHGSVTYEDPNQSSQSIVVYNNEGIPQQSSTPTNINFVHHGSTSRIGNLKHFPVPIFLSSNQPNKSLEIAMLSHKWITKFNFTQDHREDVLVRSITNDGVVHEINYNNLDLNTVDPETYIPVYQKTSDQFYPNLNIGVAPGFKVVTRLKRRELVPFGDFQEIFKAFTYNDAIYNAEGLGFIGFKGTAQTNWYTNNSNRIFTVTKYNPTLRCAIEEQYTTTGFYDFNSSSNFIDKTTYTYNHTVSNNKIFKMWVEGSLYQNALDGVFLISSYAYDEYNNALNIITSDNSGMRKQIFTFENNLGNDYYVGRPKTFIESNTVDGDVFSTQEVYTYVNNLLSKKQFKGMGLSTASYNEERYIYDIYGNITQKTLQPYSENARTQSFEFDNSGRYLTKSIDVEGLETLYTYYAISGMLKDETNPYGQKTSYEYDSWFRNTKITDYLGKSNNTSYEQNNSRLTVTDIGDDGSESKVFYDPLRRVTKTREKNIFGEWISVAYEYDHLDRVTRESEPFTGGSATQWNETEYDIYGRVTSLTQYTGKVFSITYNNLSITVNDGVKTATTTKNSRGNLLSVTDPGGTIHYNYFGNGNLKSTNYDGVIVKVEQDSWGRKTKLIDPSAGTFEYSYNGYGELISEISPKGQTDYTYSPIGKLLEKKIMGDETDMTITYAYNNSDKLMESVTVLNANGNNSSYDYTYDANKRIISIAERNLYAEFEKSFTYDSFGRVNTEKYFAKHFASNKSSTSQIIKTYQNGFLKKIQEGGFGRGKLLWEAKAVNARGQFTSESLGEKITSGNTYDSYGYLTNNNVIIHTSNGNASILNLDTDFDTERGILNSRSNSLFSWDETFQYDNLDRLISFNDNSENKSHEYDNKGRITNNSTVGDYMYGNKPYQLSGIDLNFQGDLYYQQNQRQEVIYNAFKKPVNIIEVGKEKIDFHYNAFMGRSNMFYGNTETDIALRTKSKHYSFDGSMEISYDAAAQKTTFVSYLGGDAYSTPIIWRSEQIDLYTSQGYYYLHKDYLGSILLITDYDGNAIEKRHFDAWGNIVKLTNGNNGTLEKMEFLDRGYTGHEHLQAINIIHMNGRLYDPNLRRFLAADNYIQDMTNTQSYNRYAYAFNNPLMYTDPSGNTSENGEIGGLAGTALFIAVSIGNFIDKTDFGELGKLEINRWLGTNIKSLGNDIRNAWDGTLGGFFKGLFGSNKKTSVAYLNSQELTSDPLSGSSSNSSAIPFFSSGGGLSQGFSSFSNFADMVETAASGYRYGVVRGIMSTYNFGASLGTSEGWRNLGQGFTNMGHLANQYSPEGMIMRAQLANSATNYFTNIPNMSLYEITDDVGFAVVQILEGALFSKGVGLAGKSLGTVAKVGNISKKVSSEIKLFNSLSDKFGEGYKSVSVARGKYVDIEYGQNLNAASKGVWQKVFEAGYLNGSKVEVHYFYNSTTGQYANPFIKMGEWGSKVFKNLKHL